MRPEERLKQAGFKKQKNDDGGDCCLFCNHYQLSSDKTEARCNLHNVRFWKDFEASEHICRRFDGSRIDSLFQSVAQENAESASSARTSPPRKEGCYIATAVYGDYDAPEVVTLRMFRDTVLQKSLPGKVFIKVYYTFSPLLAQKLKNHPFVNHKIKLLLDQVVALIKRTA